MQHDKVTEKIIGCAYRVYNTMGFGFLESVYENCLMLELSKAGLKAEQQKEIEVYYDDEPVGSKRINYSDFAVLAEKWLTDSQWP